MMLLLVVHSAFESEDFDLKRSLSFGMVRDFGACPAKSAGVFRARLRLFVIRDL